MPRLAARGARIETGDGPRTGQVLIAAAMAAAGLAALAGSLGQILAGLM